MKKTLGICVIFFLAIQTSKADTIDYWHVYLNNKIIREFNQYSKDLTIKLKLSEAKPYDSIRVNYFRDTPCSDCDHFLAIKISDASQDTIVKGRGTFNPLSFSVKTFLDYSTQNHKPSFWIVYCEGKHKFPVFEIEFE